VDWPEAERIAVARLRHAPGALSAAELKATEPAYAAAMAAIVPRLSEALGTELPGVVERAGVVDRAGWVAANVTTFASLISRIEGELLDQVMPAGGGLGKAAMAIANRYVTTRQLGFLLGFMGSKVLGQYDLALLDEGAQDTQAAIADALNAEGVRTTPSVVAILDDGERLVGQPAKPTPLISAEMKFITVNPTWNVPPSIIENEYLPALREDPQALDRIGLNGVHLRDCDHATIDSQQSEDRQVLVGLRPGALAGVDDEEEEVDPARSCDHRAHEALVSRDVHEREAPPVVQVERRVPEVDRDAARLFFR